jgi:glycosyltransferase 2 family protein
MLLALAAAALALWGLRDHWASGGFHWSAFARSFAELRWQWVAASFLVALATYYGRALRWSVMLQPLRPDARIWSLCKATIIGFTAVVLLGRPGEFVRPYLISIRERVPLSSQFAAWFLERICDLLAMLLMFGFALSQIQSSRARLGPQFRWVFEAGGYAVAVLVLICVVILVMLGRFPAVTRERLVKALGFLPERHHLKVERAIGAFMDGTASTTSHGSVLRLTLYTALEWGLIALCMGCLFRSHPATSSFRIQDVVIFMGFVAFGSVLQIPGVGGGVQIVAVVILTRFYGVALEVASSLAIMVWLITFVGIVPAGILLAFHEGINWRKLRDLEARALRAGAELGEPVP